LHPSELDRKSRELLARLARLRRLDARYAELVIEQRGLVADVNAEIARKHFARSLLSDGPPRQGWDRGPENESSVSPELSLAMFRRAQITIDCLNELWAANAKRMRALESTRRALRLLVKR
jgi:hypothetical protein